MEELANLAIKLYNNFIVEKTEADGLQNKIDADKIKSIIQELPEKIKQSVMKNDEYVLILSLDKFGPSFVSFEKVNPIRDPDGGNFFCLCQKALDMIPKNRILGNNEFRLTGFYNKLFDYFVSMNFSPCILVRNYKMQYFSFSADYYIAFNIKKLKT